MRSQGWRGQMAAPACVQTVTLSIPYARLPGSLLLRRQAGVFLHEA